MNGSRRRRQGKLYNQILLRYNTMANKLFKQPTRVAAAAAEPLAATGTEVDIVESVPKSLKPKALRLMKRLRNDQSIQWMIIVDNRRVCDTRRQHDGPCSRCFTKTETE